MISALRNEKTRNKIIQAVVLIAFVGLIVSMVLTARHNLNNMGLTSGFGFLKRSTGWDISFSLIDYDIRSTYQRVFIVGFLNTLFTGVIILILATILGVFIGMARVSENMMLRLIGTTYVEIFRNIPLLLQALFWYAIATHLPTPRKAEPILDSFFITARGIYMPFPNLSASDLLICLFLTIIFLMVLIWILKNKGNSMSGLGFWATITGGVIAMLAVFFIVPLFTREAGEAIISVPELKGLRIRGGLVLIPEFTALIGALVFFGSAYIGEIVRGGLLSVKKGQIEAARALGLSPFDVYWKIRIPLALRAIVPPLGNQYIWLLKGTTIGIAIGFSDLFMIASTTINQSGQTIEALGLMMLGFWVINASIGALMNMLNKAIAIKGHNTR